MSQSQSQAASAMQASQFLTKWLEENHPSLKSQHDGPEFDNTIEHHGFQVPAFSESFMSRTERSTSNGAGFHAKRPLFGQQLDTHMDEADDHFGFASLALCSPHDQTKGLKSYPMQQVDSLGGPYYHRAGSSSEGSNSFESVPPSSSHRLAFRPYEPAFTGASPPKGVPHSNAFALPFTPTNKFSPPTQRHSTNKGRHHRTATPEQRQIRALTNGVPVYTIGMLPQADRGLLCDFFEQIKEWSNAYTMQLQTLNTEQTHSLATHTTLAEYLGKPSQLSLLVAENGMLAAMIAGVLSRFIVAHTIDDHALYLSAHPQADICERLAYEWSLLCFDDHENKDDLLNYQRTIYTNLKNAPDHKTWRTTCAQTFSAHLLSKLTGLLSTHLLPAAVKERDHRLQELFVKGYRIGFRLRSAAVKWQFQWPVSGTEFKPAAMVNESRMLYGDVMSTMREVMGAASEHQVRFAVSPTIVKSDYSVGGEKSEVVHSALVHVTRKGWL